MAALTIGERKCHADMTCAAELSLRNIDHRIVRRAFLYAKKDIRVAEFASVPNGVLLVGEDDVRHSLNFGIEVKILLGRERVFRNREAVQERGGLDESHLFRFLPVDAVAKALLGKGLAESEEVKIARHFLAYGVAAVTTPLVFVGQLLIGAGGEDSFSVDDHLAVVARAAIVAALVVHGMDAGGTGFHGESNVNMADPAGELRAVNPMLEDDRGKVSFFRVIIENDATEFIRKRPLLFGSCLR